jgi:hypothetical protein
MKIGMNKFHPLPSFFPNRSEKSWSWQLIIDGNKETL